MRISDWSSDVCSSDLARATGRLPGAWPCRRSRFRLHGVAQQPDTFGGDLDDIPEAKPHRRIPPRTCAGGGAGDDHVAGLGREEGRNVAYQKATADEKQRHAIVLPQHAIEPGGEAAVGEMEHGVK